MIAETGLGVDYSSLEIGHLGHLYEGLLSLHVAVADTDLALYPTGEKKSLRYEPAKKPADIVVPSGELFWQTHTGGRKAGGVYYTPDLLVEHLVRRAVLPSLEEHLASVRDLAAVRSGCRSSRAVQVPGPRSGMRQRPFPRQRPAPHRRADRPFPRRDTAARRPGRAGGVAGRGRHSPWGPHRAW